MIKNNKRKKDVTLKSLEAALRRLPKVQPPNALKSQLIGAIPAPSRKTALGTQLAPHSRFWNYGVSTVAAALIMGFVFMLNGALTISDTSFTPFEDMSLWYAETIPQMYDQNDTCATTGFTW